MQAAQTGGVSIIRQGYGSKRGGLRNTAYKKRWFVLTEDGRLQYFENNDSTAPLGVIHLAGATVVHHRSDDFKLVIKTKARDWGMRYENNKVCGEWEMALQSAIDAIHARAQPNAINLLHLDEDKHLKALADSRAAPLACVTVTCFTWNLAARLPDIREINFLKRFRDSQILVFGLQEYLPASSSIITPQHERNQLPPLEIWNVMLQTALGTQHSLAATKSMGGMAISCFVRSDIVGHVSVLATGSVPCGIGNVLYNKVSIDVRVQFLLSCIALNKLFVAITLGSCLDFSEY